MTKTNAEKIDAIVESMASWDHEELLRWAQDARHGMLKTMPQADVTEEYEQACGPEDERSEKIYRVLVREVHVARVTVQARDREDAIAKTRAGCGRQETLAYDYTRDTDEWTVEDEDGNEV